MEARNRLEILNHQREAIERSPQESVEIESFTTPLARTVEGREVHFQLSHGRIAYVPLDELMEKVEPYLSRRHSQISEQRPELIDTVPPEQGFRLTYMFRLRPPTVDEIQESHSERPKVEDRFVLTPLADNLGETIDEALREGSQFRHVLADRRARDATITLWTYPDSFDAFRRVKKELYRLNFPVGLAFAARRADQRIFHRQQVDGRVERTGRSSYRKMDDRKMEEKKMVERKMNPCSFLQFSFLIFLPCIFL